jgi:hypothetical protein
MRLPIALTIAFVALVSAAIPACGQEPVAVDLSGGVDSRGLIMAESDKAIYRFHLTAQLDRNGEGNGTLDLDPTPQPVDDFGFPEYAAALPVVKLDCTLKLVKNKKILLRNEATGGPIKQEWSLYKISGPKITSQLSLATETGANLGSGRLLVSDKDGKGRLAVTLLRPIPRPYPPPPCHPGCFPSGTPIEAPGGARTIESLRAGDLVTTVGADGIPGQGKVESIFVTQNRLIEVRTERGMLTTTETQPLSLANGGLCAAGKLKAGDRIHSWDGRERRAVAVQEITATGREGQVYNLIIGEPVLFIAGGFLARSKPPALPSDSVQP